MADILANVSLLPLSMKSYFCFVLWKNYWPVFMKLGGRVQNGPRKNLLNFGANLNRQLDVDRQFIFSLLFKLYDRSIITLMSMAK